VETRSVKRVTELTECAVLLAISKLFVPRLVSVVAVTPYTEGIKIEEVLMGEDEILGVDVVTVEENAVVVVEFCKKQTLWLTESQQRNYQTGSAYPRVCIFRGAVNWP